MTDRVPVPGLPDVRAALESLGRGPAKRLGQNFLTDRRILERIADAAELVPGAVALEVGPGPGTLTAVLLNRGARVVAVEVDPGMIAIAERLLGAPEGLAIVRADVLAGRGEESAPGRPLPAAVEAALADASASRAGWSLVANLPYQVASTLLVDLFWRARPPRIAAVTVQREVADRMVAPPATRAYGPLSVLLQLRARMRIVMKLPPGAFWPRPKVDSACVRLEPLERTEADAPAPALLARVARGVFHARRKQLANSLRLALPERDGAVVERVSAALLAERGLDPRSRGEALAPPDVVELARRLERS